jgi:tetratricopeptide (TPR) repeat protein
MHVPLLIVGPGVAPSVSDAPVSTRRIFHTLLDFAGLGAADSLRGGTPELVLGEAMKPFLEYGWQPQVMAIEGATKTIQAGQLEVYDLSKDAAESQNLAASADLSRPLRTALREYPTPSLAAQRAPDTLNAEERQKLASLGYVSAGVAPLVRKGAPRPAAMARLLESIERASGLFVRERYAEVIPLLEKILGEDPGNLDARLRLATAHSLLGHDAQAIQDFERAWELAPDSADVRTYLALHYARGKDWPRAAALLERVVAETPDRLPALEGLARVRERQGRIEEAIALRQRVYGLRTPTAAELVALGELAMTAEKTPLATLSFEKARALQGASFSHDLELGVLYLSAKRFAEARDALDRVPASAPSARRPPTEAMLIITPGLSRIACSHAAWHQNSGPRRLTWNVLSKRPSSTPSVGP